MAFTLLHFFLPGSAARQGGRILADAGRRGQAARGATRGTRGEGGRTRAVRAMCSRRRVVAFHGIFFVFLNLDAIAFDLHSSALLFSISRGFVFCHAVSCSRRCVSPCLEFSSVAMSHSHPCLFHVLRARASHHSQYALELARQRDELKAQRLERRAEAERARMAAIAERERVRYGVFRLSGYWMMITMNGWQLGSS